MVNNRAVRLQPRYVAAFHPWSRPPLDKWAICGMNHYHVSGKRMLFVAMTRHGKCIKAEGSDDEYLWNRLCHLAWEAEEETLHD